MGLRLSFDSTTLRGWVTGLASVVLLFGFTAAVLGDLPEDHPDRDRDRGRGLTASTTPVITTIEANRVIAFLTERGEFGASAGSVAGGGFWRATTDQYIFSSGINVGAVANGDTLVAIGGPFSELVPGSPTIAQDLSVFWDSTDPSDAANFPEVCTVDSFRTSVFPSLQPFGGLPFPGFADQTICIAVNDLTGSTCSDCAGTRLGIESDQTYFEFGIPAVQDFAFTIYRIFNRSAFVTAENAPNQTPGPYEFTNTTVGIAIDPDVGEAGDDQIAFLPDVRTMVYWDSDFTEPQFQNPAGFGGVTALDVVLSTDVGQAGLVPAQDEVFFAEFTVFTNGAPRPDPSSKEEWYQGMTGDLSFVILEVQPRDIRGMVTTSLFDLPPGEFVELYGAFFFAAATGALPADLRAEAYKDLATGEIIPTANDDVVFDNFKNTQRTAQSVFDAGFIVPTAPPKPELELIPGDQKVTVAWKSDPVEAVNPFAKVARDPFVRLPSGEPDPDAPGVGIIIDANDVVFDPALDQGGTTGFVRAGSLGLGGVEATNAAFDPGFVIQDFQSFKVYRSLTGQADDAELIAAFDLADGIVTDELCVNASVVTQDGEPFTAVCTETQEFVIGGDTGLNFAVVDRGGTFPNPGAGPGLINGIPIFYSVTSVGVNCGQLLVDVPASVVGDLTPAPACLTLEAGLSPLRSAVPRSESSALTGGEVTGIDLVDDQGEVLSGVSAGSFEVDDDGNLTSAVIPPANGWTANVTPVRPGLLPPDFQIFFQVDSMPMGPDYVPGCDFSECFLGFGVTASDGLNAADTRNRIVFVSLRDASGNVLSTPAGPATAQIATGFITFGGTTTIATPTFAIVPEGASEVAATASFTITIPRRDNQCGRLLICGVTTEDGVTTPASLANFFGAVAMYGQVGVRDVEVVWSNQGGNLTFSSVRDISNGIDLAPVTDFGASERGWGFALPTELGPGAVAWNDVGMIPIPTLPDGRALWPDPIASTAQLIACGICSTAFMGATQFAPLWWSDLPSSTDAELQDIYAASGGLNAFASSYVPVEARQPGTLGPTAAIATDPAGNPFTRLHISGHEFNLSFNQLPADGEVWRFRMRHGVPGTPRPLVPGSRIRIDLPGATNELADADLGEIKVVPNPFIAANEITRGRGLQRILFTNLPPRATIRIYTVSGNLVRILEHADGSGTAEWDVRTRFDLIVASGIYYWHVTTPDGRTQLGRFAVVN